MVCIRKIVLFAWALGSGVAALAQVTVGIRNQSNQHWLVRAPEGSSDGYLQGLMANGPFPLPDRAQGVDGLTLTPGVEVYFRAAPLYSNLKVQFILTFTAELETTPCFGVLAEVQPQASSAASAKRNPIRLELYFNPKAGPVNPLPFASLGFWEHGGEYPVFVITADSYVALLGQVYTSACTPERSLAIGGLPALPTPGSMGSLLSSPAAASGPSPLLLWPIVSCPAPTARSEAPTVQPPAAKGTKRKALGEAERPTGGTPSSLASAASAPLPQPQPILAQDHASLTILNRSSRPWHLLPIKDLGLARVIRTAPDQSELQQWDLTLPADEVVGLDPGESIQLRIAPSRASQELNLRLLDHSYANPREVLIHWHPCRPLAKGRLLGKGPAVPGLGAWHGNKFIILADAYPSDAPLPPATQEPNRLASPEAIRTASPVDAVASPAPLLPSAPPPAPAPLLPSAPPPAPAPPEAVVAADHPGITLENETMQPVTVTLEPHGFFVRLQKPEGAEAAQTFPSIRSVQPATIELPAGDTLLLEAQVGAEPFRLEFLLNCHDLRFLHEEAGAVASFTWERDFAAGPPLLLPTEGMASGACRVQIDGTTLRILPPQDSAPDPIWGSPLLRPAQPANQLPGQRDAGV